MDLNKQFNRWNFDEFYKEFTIENMEKMINDYMDGKIKPPTKSEEIPEKQEKTVYKLVNKSFQKEVLDSDINVFVKFYSPHCGHCIKLQPAFEELAEKLKYNKNLIVAEYNLIANDFDWFRIRGYPTLVMFKAGDKKNHIIYEGNRTVEDMMNFVISNLGEVKDKKEEEKKKKEEEDKKKKEEEERKKKEEDKKKKEEEERKRKEEEIKKKEEQKKIEEEMKKKIEEKQKKIGEEQAKINEEENKAKEKKAKKKKAKEKKN
jgi:protein disulfide-isomerase A1